MQHHVAIVEHQHPFEIQHFFVYVFRGYPELGGDFRLFFKVRFAVTRKHPLRHPTSQPSSFFGSFAQWFFLWFPTSPANALHRACKYTAQALQIHSTKPEIHWEGPANTLHMACKYIAQGLQIHCKGHRLHRDSTFCAQFDSMPSEPYDASAAPPAVSHAPLRLAEQPSLWGMLPETRNT